MKRDKKILYKASFIGLMLVLIMYVATFYGIASQGSINWGSISTLIAPLGALFFSVINIGIWLYQSELSITAMNRQVVVQEQITVLTELQSKLLLVSKNHGSYQEFKKIYWEAYRELTRWEIGIYKHIFTNYSDYISDAFRAICAIDGFWHNYYLTQDEITKEATSDTNDEDIQNNVSQLKLIELELPLLKIIQFYRAQINILSLHV